MSDYRSSGLFVIMSDFCTCGVLPGKQNVSSRLCSAFLSIRLISVLKISENKYLFICLVFYSHLKDI